MCKIPELIHQIWIQGQDNMPSRYQSQAQTWQKHNPSWEYVLWDVCSLHTLINDHYNELLPVYDAYESVVARADIGRYVLLDAFGGVYADTDMICVRSLDQHLADPNVSLYVQVYDNPVCQAVPGELIERVSNAFIACTPTHTFWHYVFNFFGSLLRVPKCLVTA